MVAWPKTTQNRIGTKRDKTPFLIYNHSLRFLCFLLCFCIYVAASVRKGGFTALQALIVIAAISPRQENRENTFCSQQRPEHLEAAPCE